MAISKKNDCPDYSDQLQQIAEQIAAGFNQLCKVLEQMKPPITGPIKPLEEPTQQPTPPPAATPQGAS